MDLNPAINSGARAIKTGSNLESFVSEALLRCGYSQHTNNKNGVVIENMQFQHQYYTGETVYGSKRIADFLVVNKELFPNDLIIECKWQQSAGSVDEKYPFLILNINKTNIPTVILLDGGGYKDGAKEWLINQVYTNECLIGVWDMSEFQRKINNNFLG
jgi:hypothetical protein